jgi:hypothetical protein
VPLIFVLGGLWDVMRSVLAPARIPAPATATVRADKSRYTCLVRRRTNCGRRGPIVAFAAATVIAGTPLGAADAAAQDDTEPIRLSYRAPEGCPDEASFVARIRERTKRARLAWTGEPARTFTVIVEAGPPPSGRVAIQAGGESQGMRRVQADTCSDVSDALALVIALAIDPRATLAAAPSAAAASAAPSTPPSKVSAPAPVTNPAGEASAVFAGADVTVATGIAPRVLFGGSPYVGWRSAGATIWQPSLRLAFVRVGSGPLDVQGGKAEFTWTVGRLDVCPIVWPRGTVRLTECVRVEAGTLEGARADVTSPPSHPDPWLSAGLLVRAEWSPLVWAFIDAEVGGLLRVTQDWFWFDSANTPFHEVPLVGVTAGVGLGVRFF